MDKVFKALGDATRRTLLDRLFEQDGQTLSALCAGMKMSRQAVSKHLVLLEQANLVVPYRYGREKHHYLNPAPILAIHDRWIHKYHVLRVRALARLKRSLEDSAMYAPEHVFVTYIRTTPGKLWQAITDPDFTCQYFFGTRLESEWKQDGTFVYRSGEGRAMVDGEVIEIDPPHRLVLSWRTLYDAEQAADAPSRVTWQIEKVGESCRLTVIHDRISKGSKTWEEVRDGWPGILASLKSLLETGTALADVA